MSGNRRTEMERILKIVESSVTGLPSSYGYARKILRLVRCRPDQKGWKSESGVEILWESGHYDPRSKGPKSKYAKFLAQAENRMKIELSDDDALMIEGQLVEAIYQCTTCNEWRILKTDDGRYWLDTDPQNPDSSCSRLNPNDHSIGPRIDHEMTSR